MLTDEERSILVNKIESDISAGKINGEINLIISEYISQYNENKNKIKSFKYLDMYILSNSFKKVTEKFDYDENTLKNIIHNLGREIENDNLKYNDIKTKFEIYLRGQNINKKYYDELQKYRDDVNVYCIQYNLTKDEMNGLFDEIEMKINENNGSMDIKTILTKGIENLVMNIKTQTFEYLNSEEMSKLIVNLNLTNEENEKIIEHIKNLIYTENLRIHEINNQFLNNLREDLINNGKINSN